MKLLTKQIIAKIPKLYETEMQPIADKIAYAKFFHPIINWTWYVTEYDGQNLCFGLVKGTETELGYFSINELESVDWYGVKVERDLYFRPTPLQDLPIHDIDHALV